MVDTEHYDLQVSFHKVLWEMEEIYFYDVETNSLVE